MAEPGLGHRGCAGVGRHIANRLLADGEQVVDVPPKLSARARVFATGQGRKTDATDAHSVALVGARSTRCPARGGMTHSRKRRSNERIAARASDRSASRWPLHVRAFGDITSASKRAVRPIRARLRTSQSSG